MNKKEIEIWEFEMPLKNFFCLRSNLSNDDVISAWGAGLKTGMDFRDQARVARSMVSANQR